MWLWKDPRQSNEGWRIWLIYPKQRVGLEKLSLRVCTWVCTLVSHSVVTDSLQSHGLNCQPPLSMEFSRQELWSGVPFFFLGDLPNPGIFCEFFWIMKNHHFLSSERFHLRIFYLIMWIHRLWIEFPKWCSPNGKYIKIMILLIWGIPGLVSLASGSICFFLYIHHCLCSIVWQRCRSTGHGDVVHQMGLESNQVGVTVCIAWIGLFDIPENVGERNEVGYKEGIYCVFIVH